MLSTTQIGRYEIRRKLGAGGMGEVYLAHDPNLGRDVALKVLPAEFSRDADRLIRFRQEARAVSALNHPNILTIYEIGEAEGGWFIATELVRGETLRDFIGREKSLSVLQSIKIAEQIAGALAAAHEAHIIHRDIKPENIMIRPDGYVKILDFGLAKPLLMQSAPEDATVQIAQTTPGLVMGSVRYMSPEQARGKETDERTDLWSLGVCLFEMLAGKPPFDGETMSDTIAALIYTDAPPIAEFAQAAPPELQRIVRKALRKDKNERYQTAKDFALDLKSLRDDVEHGANGELQRLSDEPFGGENQTAILSRHNSTDSNLTHQTNNSEQKTRTADLSKDATAILSTESSVGLSQINSRQPKRRQRLIFASIAGVLILAALGLVGYRFWSGAKTNSAATAFAQTQIARLVSDGKARRPAISPDGNFVAFVSGEVGSRSLVVRQIATDSTIVLVPPTAQQFAGVDFAPDGNFVFYVLRDTGGSFGTLFRIPTLGGESKKIIEDVDSRISFAPDGKRFIFLRHTSDDGDDLLIIAEADGSNPQEFASAKKAGWTYFESPAWSPDGEKIVIGAGKYSGEAVKNTRITEISLKDKSIRVLNDKTWNGANDFHWLHDGSAVLFLGSEGSNNPMQIWLLAYPEGVLRRVTNDTSKYVFLSAAADDATLVSVVSTASGSIWTASASGKELNQLTENNRRMDGGSGIAEGADGKLFYTRDEESEVNIYKSDADGKNAVKLTTNAKFNLDLSVSPDGKFVVFVSNRSGAWRVWRMDADGQGAIQLSDGENVGDSRPAVSADNSTVIFSRQIGNNGRAFIMKVPLAGGVSEKLSDDDKSYDAFPRISPDGKSIAYVAFDAATLGIKKKLLIREYVNGALGAIKFSFEYDLIDDFRWAPNSKSLTLQRSEGTPNLWQLSLDTKRVTPLTEFNSGRIFYFAWSRDDKKIFVARGNVNNELVLIKNLTN